MDRRMWILTTTWTRTLAAAAIVASPGHAEAQLKKIDAATAREMLSSPHAGEPAWWVASNAGYRARNDRLPDYYAMRFELAPGGYASTGCRWGARDGELRAGSATSEAKARAARRKGLKGGRPPGSGKKRKGG